MENKVDLSEYSKSKLCENKCDRQVVMTREGAVIVCLWCKRIVMDRRE